MTANTKTPIEHLRRQLIKRFPNARLSLDKPAKPDAEWYLDIEHDGRHVITQWQQQAGFGVSCSAQHAYGEGPDEVYQDLEAAYSRIVSLLLSKQYTAPPPAVRMAELRKQRGVSQQHLASLLQVNQAAISKLERRNDMLVSSVRQVVRSMGGELKLIATFPDGVERTLEFEEGDAPETGPREAIGKVAT